MYWIAWKIGAGVRLDRDSILGTEDIEIERGHERRNRGARRLVSPHLSSPSRPLQVIGVVNHPGGKPENFALERPKADQPPLLGRSDRDAATIIGGRRHGD